MTDERDDDLLAAELAFGLLDAEESRAAEQRLGELGFAQLHQRWQDWALTLLDDRPVIPPAEVWNAIRGHLPANEDRSARQLRRWKLAAALSAVAALSLGVLALDRRAHPVPAPVAAPRPAGPSLLAVLKPQHGDALVLVSFDRSSRQLSAAMDHVSIASRSAQLWVIAAGGKPKPLGLLQPGKTSLIVLSPPIAEQLAQGAALAVSSEPKGGSPTGLPTGPILVSGQIQPA